jgi:predicted DNA-binding transcriptional regulator AlpA
MGKLGGLALYNWRLGKVASAVKRKQPAPLLLLGLFVGPGLTRAGPLQTPHLPTTVTTPVVGLVAGFAFYPDAIAPRSANMLFTTTPRTFMEIKEVLELINVTSRTLRNWVALGRFPKPLPIGRRRLYWCREDVMRALGQKRRKATMAAKK